MVGFLVLDSVPKRGLGVTNVHGSFGPEVHDLGPAGRISATHWESEARAPHTWSDPM